MNPGSSATPLYCDMSVFTPLEREGHIQTISNLLQNVQSIRDLENGYEFSFPKQSEVITTMAEFIAKERLCCPFLDFTLKIQSNEEFLSLALTGPEGTPEFLREEFSQAFV